MTEEKERLESITKGELVWEYICRHEDFDYHPAIVKEVNIDKKYVKVIDVSDGNKEKTYHSFVTQEELIGSHGFTRETIINEYAKYSKIRAKIVDGKL